VRQPCSESGRRRARLPQQVARPRVCREPFERGEDERLELVILIAAQRPDRRESRLEVELPRLTLAESRRARRPSPRAVRLNSRIPCGLRGGECRAAGRGVAADDRLLSAAWEPPDQASGRHLRAPVEPGTLRHQRDTTTSDGPIAR